MINKILIALIFSITPSLVKATPVIKITCEDYNLTTINFAVTKTYETSFCKDDNKDISNKYYYLGSMRKNNSDYFTLLPVISWASNFYVAENEGHYYIFNATGATPVFSIYKGKELLDSEFIETIVINN